MEFLVLLHNNTCYCRLTSDLHSHDYWVARSGVMGLKCLVALFVTGQLYGSVVHLVDYMHRKHQEALGLSPMQFSHILFLLL